MKKLLIAVFVMFGGYLFAGGSSLEYIPAEVSLPFEFSAGTGAEFVVPKFFPVGWSKDGKFAYFTYSSFEYDGSPNTVFQFCIQNLIDDKVVWQTSFAKGKEVSLPEIWSKYQGDINNKLAQYKISQYEGELGTFPVKSKKGYVDYQIRVTQKKSSLGYTYFDTIEFRATLDKSSDKVIYKEKNAQAIKLSVPGFMKSPFEDRVAVILMKVKRSDQDNFYPVELQIIGCHLTIGYKAAEIVEDPVDPDQDEFEIEIDDDGNF